jgi:1,4-dihydroxy-2-naphthoate octaprenyltransferase
MDIVPDRETGRTTTAVRIGAVRTKLLMAVLLGVEVVLVTQALHDRVIGAFLAVGMVWFVVDALWLWRNSPYSRKTMRLFMWMWNAAALWLIVWDYLQGTFVRSARLAL